MSKPVKLKTCDRKFYQVAIVKLILIKFSKFQDI